MSINEHLDGLGPRALVEVIGEAYERLAAAPLWSLSETETLQHVRDLNRVARAHEAARLTAVSEVETRGSAVAAGAASTKAWLASELLERPSAAHRDVGVAQGLAERYAATRAALAEGRISGDHMRAICWTLDHLPSTLPPETLAAAEAQMVELALHYDPATLAKLGRHLAYVLDPDGDKELAAHEARMRERRGLHLSPRDSGLWDLRGVLDGELGNSLHALIDAFAAPQPSTAEGPDPRTPPQRRHDALEEIVRRVTADDDVPSSGGERPTLVVTTTVDALQRQLGSEASSLPDGSPQSAGALRRLACEARVIPIVLGGDSQPFDLGRGARIPPAWLRRLVLMRDNYQCAIPGCGAIPRQCHHIVHWADDGPTELDNLVSLCGRCHRLIHSTNNPWSITAVSAGRPTFTRNGPAP